MGVGTAAFWGILERLEAEQEWRGGLGNWGGGGGGDHDQVLSS